MAKGRVLLMSGAGKVREDGLGEGDDDGDPGDGAVGAEKGIDKEGPEDALGGILHGAEEEREEIAPVDGLAEDIPDGRAGLLRHIVGMP